MQLCNVSPQTNITRMWTINAKCRTYRSEPSFSKYLNQEEYYRCFALESKMLGANDVSITLGFTVKDWPILNVLIYGFAECSEPFAECRERHRMLFKFPIFQIILLSSMLCVRFKLRYPSRSFLKITISVLKIRRNTSNSNYTVAQVWAWWRHFCVVCHLIPSKSSMSLFLLVRR